MNLPASVLVFTVAVASWLGAPRAGTAEIRLDAKVFIEIQADGKHCVVKKVELLCAEAISYLQNTLKLPLETEVGVKAAQAAPYKDVKWVLDQVGKSGYVHPVAYLTEPKG